MHLIFLDGAQGLIVVPFLFIGDVIFTMFLEGGVLYYYGYKRPFRKCLLDAFIVNLISLIIGLCFLGLFRNLADYIFDTGERGGIHRLLVLGFFYIETVIVEGLILKLLNKSWPWNQLITANLVMNFLSYIAIYFILKWT